MQKQARFYVQQKDVFRDRFLINDKDVCNYLRQVIRVEVGAKVVLFDGQGYEYESEIRFLSKEQVSGVVLEKRVVEEPWPYVVLAQALPKAGKADDIIRMNTEVGVRGFVFFKSEYSIPGLESYDDKKLERFKRVIAEASRQSERAFLPQISSAQTFVEILKTDVDVKILLHSREVEGSLSLKDIKIKHPKAESFLVAVGPEGGFSAAEIEQAKKAGFEIGYLTAPILRTETAGVVACGYLIQV